MIIIRLMIIIQDRQRILPPVIDQPSMNCMPVFVIMDSPQEAAIIRLIVNMIQNGFIVMMKMLKR